MKEKFLCCKDSCINNWIRDQSSKNYNYGNSKVLISEGAFHTPIFDFDLESLKGKKIKKAWLYLRYLEHPFVRYEVSTISVPWQEGTGDGKDHPMMDGATFELSGDNQPWPNEGRFSGFIFGNNNSTYCVGEAEVLEDGWQRLEIDPQLIYERAYGRSFGYALVDGRAHFFEPVKISPWEYKIYDKSVYSRESEFAPYMEVEFEDCQAKADVNIKCFESPDFPYSLEFDRGQMQLQWSMDGDLDYVYFKLYCKNDDGEQEVQAYEVPKYRRGQKCYSTVLSQLKPSCSYQVRLEVWDKTTKVAEQTITAVSTCAKEKPSADLSVICKELPGTSILADGIYVIDENTKVNPVDGSLFYNELDGRSHTLDTLPSYIQDGKARFKGVKNEFLAFQLVLKGKNINSKFELLDASLANGSHSLTNVKPYKVWYVKAKEKWIPEVAVPADQDISKLLGRDPLIPDQEYQNYYIEILIPKDAQDGTYQGTLSFTVDGSEFSLPMEIEVLPHVLSDDTGFICDLNGYSPAYAYEGYSRIEMPDQTALKYEEEYYKVAHAHRCNYNPLGYGQGGDVYAGYAPEIEGDGENVRIKNWKEWDERFEKYFTGEAFKDCPRSGVPITNVYLPIHENWPAELEKYYKVKVESKDYPQMVTEHYMKANDPWVDFEKGYKAAIKKILKDFIQHIDEKGWQHINFQFFMNNKYYWKDPNMEGNNGIMGTSWWCLDEPFYRDDWKAIRFFAEMLREAQDELKSGYNVVFRADLSFAYLQFYYLDGLLDLCCTTSHMLLNNYRQMKVRQQQFNEEFWTYGAGNHPRVSNMNSYATILLNYLTGSKGFLPWDSYGTYDCYNMPVATALIYPAGRAGVFEPNISLRMKMMRRALQDLEYLRLVQRKYNYDHEQIGALLEGILQFNVEAQNVDLQVTAQTHRNRYYIDSINIRELALSLL